MNTSKTRDLPSVLEGLRRRFERWRATRKAHARVPDSLWASAALLAGRYGISRTANVLGVNYNALKKRIGSKTAAATGRAEMRGTAGFVELAPFTPAAPCECFVELEDASGAKMRVRLQGVGMPDLVTLGQSFWDR